MKQSVNNSTLPVRVACAVVFFIFSFCYLYFYQADVLAMGQHVKAEGQTRYEPLIGAVLITVVLYLLHLVVFAVTRLYKRFHALTYFPSLLFLLFLTHYGEHLKPGFSVGWWTVAVVLLLAAFAWVAWTLYQLQPYEPKTVETGLLSRLSLINMFTLTVMFLLVCLLANHNDVFHYRMRMESLMRNGRYAEAVEVGKRSPQTDGSLLMLRVYALAHEHQLGERLFEFPISGGRSNMRPGPDAHSLMIPELEITRFASGSVADDYRLCGYLLDKDLGSFVASVSKCYDIRSPRLPKHYKEALTLYMHKSPSPTVAFHDNVLEADYEDLRRIVRETPDNMEKYNTIRETYGNTYWFYWMYGNRKVSEK